MGPVFYVFFINFISLCVNFLPSSSTLSYVTGCAVVGRTDSVIESPLSMF